LITVQIVIVGSIMMFALYWQFRLIGRIFGSNNHAFATNIGIPATIGMSIILGNVLIIAFSNADSGLGCFFGEQGIGLGDFVICKENYPKIRNAAIFTAILMAKGFLSPLSVGFLTSYSVYTYFEKGVLEIWPMMEVIISLIIESADENTAFYYTIAFVVLSLILNAKSLTDGPTDSI
jgi:hypothetical protein